MLAGRHGHRLNAWIAAVEADDLPELHSYANGLKRDYDAVATASPWPTAPAPQKARSTGSK
jgi:hypothetical protein